MHARPPDMRRHPLINNPQRPQHRPTRTLRNPTTLNTRQLQHTPITRQQHTHSSLRSDDDGLTGTNVFHQLMAKLA